MRDAHPRDDARNIHHSEQRRAGARHLTWKDRPVCDHSVDRATYFRIGELRLRGFVFPFRRIGLALGAFDFFVARYALNGFQMSQAGIVLAFGLCIGDGRLVHEPPRQSAITEKLFAAL